MKSTIRYFISEPISKSVANSQMFNWGEVLAAKGLRTEFIIFYRSKQDLKSMIEDTTQPIVEIPVIKFFLIRNLIHFISLLTIYFKAKHRFEKIIFQSRTNGVSPSLALLRLLPGVKVITDIRGFEIEQFDNNSIKDRIKLWNSELYIKLSVNYSDKIFCVSKPLVNLITERYNVRIKDKFAVFGGVADESHFYYNDDLRNRVRKEIGVVDKTVVLYSGMLNMPWQQPEKYFDFFLSLSNIRSDLFLVMLTPNIEIANELKLRYKIKDSSILIKESSYPDLVRYYNMADFGMLFRKDEIVNRVASPTKFSEYALCGLPVLISDNIGDFSNYIKETGYGYVVQNNEHIEDECDAIAQYITDFKIVRPIIAAFSKNNYSKQAQANRLFKIYQEI
jgi:hypothetical protein